MPVLLLIKITNEDDKVMFDVVIKDTNQENFKQYGIFISRPQSSAQVDEEKLKYWHNIYKSNLNTNDITMGFLSISKQEMIIKELERHKKYGEIFITVKGEGVLPVAKADNNAAQPDIESVEFFNLKPGDAVLINKGVWHLPPLPFTDSIDFLMVLPVEILDDLDKVQITPIKL
jgi:ureidoglycolate lyase